jgi:hypothetical protein
MSEAMIIVGKSQTDGFKNIELTLIIQWVVNYYNIKNRNEKNINDCLILFSVRIMC